jgi:alanyl-tRNA synthetase
MTERLFYHDSFLAEFDARVVSCVPTADGRFHAVLDRTAFYPTSGGQPNDTGRLGESTVVDVVDSDGGEILHITDRPVTEGPVHAVVDWPRRFDHMQQHTGQHLLSAIFVAQFGYPTVSFHLGRVASSIDLAAPGISAEQLAAVEQRCNQIIFEDRPVHVRFGTRDELAAAGVRKEVQREGTLRAIEIEGVELNPCGGTHVARTGQIGLLLVRRCEKQKGNWRVEFLCGGRALAAARKDWELLGEAAHILGGAPAEVPAMAARRVEERKEAQRQRKDLLVRLAEFEAKALWDSTASGSAGMRPGVRPGIRMIQRVLQGADAEYLRLLATGITALGGAVALLATDAGGHMVFAQSAGLSGDMNALLREVLSTVGGKGGGTRDFAQGSCPDPAPAGRLEGILEAASARLSSSAAPG